MKPVVVTLTGPSCAGKSTLEKMLKEKGFAALVSTTTRTPRPGEKQGEAYHFVTQEEFTRGVAEGEFVESVEFNGNRYGLTAAEFERQFSQGKPVVAVVEPSGRQQIEKFAKARGWGVIKVYVGNRAETIARRFLLRFAEETDLATTPEARVKSLNVTAARLATMLTTEQAWILESITHPVYTLTLQFFDERNDKEVSGSLAAFALALQVADAGIMKAA